MGYVWGAAILCLYMSACAGNYVTPDPASTQSTTTPQCIQCPKKTTTHHSTLHTNHTTTPYTTQHTNHTTTPYTTLHTNHTTTPYTTQHTNHTTLHTTQHTNHTTPHTTQHTNHTTPHATQHTNHTTPHHTTNPHTTQHPTTTPPSYEYFVNGTSGVCLRIRASFKIKVNGTKEMEEIVIPAPPSTKASGNCSAQQARLTLTFPRGHLSLTFRQNETEKNFYLGAVNITLDMGSEQFSNTSMRDLVTPLGRSFSCEQADLEVTPKLQFVVMDVRAQAFKLQGENYGKEFKCSRGPPNMTVPIVIGVLLLVLILIVVLAYIIARQRSHRGYQTL